MSLGNVSYSHHNEQYFHRAIRYLRRASQIPDYHLSPYLQRCAACIDKKRSRLTYVQLSRRLRATGGLMDGSRSMAEVIERGGHGALAQGSFFFSCCLRRFTSGRDTQCSFILDVITLVLPCVNVANPCRRFSRETNSRRCRPSPPSIS
jgi:hypothetical protein